MILRGAKAVFLGAAAAGVLASGCRPAESGLRGTASANLSRPQEPKLFGVAVHAAHGLVLRPASLEFIERFRPILRTPIYWMDVEPEEGPLRVPDKYDRIRAIARENGTQLAVVLGYNHTTRAESCREGAHVRGGQCIAGVATEANRDAFVAYASFLAGQLAAEVAVWEIWNEPNHDPFWKPEPSVEDFIALAERVAPAIRSADSSSYIVTGGTAYVDFDFIERLLESGVYRQVDAIGIHMNMMKPGKVKIRREGKVADASLSAVLSRLEELHEEYGASFLVTEFGFPLYSSAYDRDADQRKLRRALVGQEQRSLVEAYRSTRLSDAISGIIIYQLQDDLIRSNPLGGIRGLVDAFGERKPAVDYFSEP
ncbi:MAG: hypothetical protein ACE5JR_07730 [Gemmatimonadota bacterium]